MLSDNRTITGEDQNWMRRAINAAAVRGRDPLANPIGCAVVLDGICLVSVSNMTAQTGDQTAHAEMVALREVGPRVGEDSLRRATLYSTLEPCGMCTMASLWAKVGRVVYGAGRADVHPMYFEDRHLHAIDFIRDAWRDDIVIIGGCLREECAALYFSPNDEVPVALQGNR